MSNSLFRRLTQIIAFIDVGLILLMSCAEGDPLSKQATIHLTEILNLDMLSQDDFIVEFEFDQAGILWVGTFNSGLYRISSHRIDNFSAQNSPLPNNRINDIFIDYQNSVWVATDNGFARYVDNTWEVSTIEDTPLIIPRVSEISVNRTDEILVGNGNASEGGLLFRTSQGIWKNFNTGNSGLPCSIIKEIELTDTNDFWISTGQFQGKGGIAMFKNGAINKIVSVENGGLLYNDIDNIEVSQQELWIGYWVAIYDESGFPDGGIQKLTFQNDKLASFFPNETNLLSNRVRAMKLHSDKSLWFTTSIDDPGCDNCLAGIGVRRDNGDLLAISAINADISANSFLPKLNEDNQGNMYVATEQALHRIEIR